MILSDLIINTDALLTKRNHYVISGYGIEGQLKDTVAYATRLVIT